MEENIHETNLKKDLSRYIKNAYNLIIKTIQLKMEQKIKTDTI